MISKQVGPFWNVKEIIDLFTAMGCELRIAEPDTFNFDGEVFNVRYLFNPDNGNFVALVDLRDDEAVHRSEVESWERRLGIEIPKPPT